MTFRQTIHMKCCLVSLKHESKTKISYKLSARKQSKCSQVLFSLKNK